MDNASKQDASVVRPGDKVVTEHPVFRWEDCGIWCFTSWKLYRCSEFNDFTMWWSLYSRATLSEVDETGNDTNNLINRPRLRKKKKSKNRGCSHYLKSWPSYNWFFVWQILWILCSLRVLWWRGWGQHEGEWGELHRNGRAG